MKTQALSSLAIALATHGAASLKLNVTAIGARDGSSTLECWQMDQSFHLSTEIGLPGVAVATLGGTADLIYTVLPSGFDAGLHTAPRVQWILLTSGTLVITLPDDSSMSAHVSGGQFGLMFAADTADVSQKGHHTRYLSVTEAVLLQIPTLDGKVPCHSVLHMGPCGANEITGIREFMLGVEDLEPAGLRSEGWVDNLLPFPLGSL